MYYFLYLYLDHNYLDSSLIIITHHHHRPYPFWLSLFCISHSSSAFTCTYIYHWLVSLALVIICLCISRHTNSFSLILTPFTALFSGDPKSACQAQPSIAVAVPLPLHTMMIRLPMNQKAEPEIVLHSIRFTRLGQYPSNSSTTCQRKYYYRYKHHFRCSRCTQVWPPYE